MSQKCCSYAKILRTGFNISINAACSGLLVQDDFIPRFCCNKYLGCLSYFIAFKVYNRESIRQVSFLDNITDSRIELKSLTCINRSFFRWFSYSCIRLKERLRLGSSTSHVLWTIVPAVCGE